MSRNQAICFLLLLLLPLPAATVMPVRAQVCETGGEFAQAACDVKVSKRQARMHHDRAVVLANHGCIESAIAEDRLAIEGNPDHCGYQILMARLLTDRGQLQSALATYERVCRRWPEQLEDLAELIAGLKWSMAFLKLDQALAHAQTSAPGSPPLTELQLRQLVERSQPVPDAVAADTVKNPSPMKAATHEIIKRLLSDGRPLDDPAY